MKLLLQTAALLAASVLVINTAASQTHVAAVNKHSFPAPSKEARRQPIEVNSSKVDYQGDTVVFKDVVITQGETKVQADRAHATGLEDFDNSHWTIEGNVRITGEQHGSLKSDVAVVEFKNKYISKATATGNPAEFEQKRTDIDEVAKGRAHEIVYNVSDGTVRLSNEAWVFDGRNAMSADQIVYSIREQHLQGTSNANSGGPVRITIDPNARGKDNDKKP